MTASHGRLRHEEDAIQPLDVGQLLRIDDAAGIQDDDALFIILHDELDIIQIGFVYIIIALCISGPIIAFCRITGDHIYSGLGRSGLDIVIGKSYELCSYDIAQKALFYCDIIIVCAAFDTILIALLEFIEP